MQRAGVPIVAGTDTFCWPFITPGLSLHEELACLEGTGMSRFAVLRAATAEPASLLGRGGEFGTIVVGARADLVLTNGNPLQDLNTLRTPRGVMTRGRWLSREMLQAGLDALSGGTLPTSHTRAAP